VNKVTDKTNLNWKQHTLALHGGEDENYADAHVTPIFSTSTFSFPNTETGEARFTGKDDGFIYTRLGNPTIKVSEKKIAILEGFNLLKTGINVEGHAFATGMACIASALMAFTQSGKNIVAGNPIYGGTNYFLDGIMKPYFVSTNYVDTSGDEGTEEVKRAINKDTKVIYLESPANPNLTICDIEEISKLAKENNIITMVDNTFATPILQRPLELGANIALHSTTKYLNGHGTTVSGLLASNLPEVESRRLVYIKKNLGATQSPFDAFLVSNGMKTLPLRVAKHCLNALVIAEYLQDHPKVETVHYPGLPDHPQHNLAKKQMHGKFGGMIACELKNGLESGRILMNSVKIFTLAVSLGCIDSLIQHPASMTHVSVPKSIRLQGGITDGLIRISVGIEDVEDLIEDLDQALNKIG
jgi:methionine-gamma-lyase